MSVELMWKFCELFEKTPEELGFKVEKTIATTDPTITLNIEVAGNDEPYITLEASADGT